MRVITYYIYIVQNATTNVNILFFIVENSRKDANRAIKLVKENILPKTCIKYFHLAKILDNLLKHIDL